MFTKDIEVSTKLTNLGYAELTSFGFTKYTAALLTYLKKHDLPGNVWVFKGRGSYNGRSTKYSIHEFFGFKQLTYYVIDSKEAKNDFELFLYELFLKNDFSPGPVKRREFARFLSEYGMNNYILVEPRIKKRKSLTPI